MKIWFICQFAHTPESGRYLRHYFLSKNLVEKGIDTTFIYSRSNGAIYHKFFGFRRKYLDASLKCIQINGPLTGSGINFKRIIAMVNFEFLLLLTTIFTKKKNRPDVIIVSSLSLLTFFSGVILKKLFKCKLVLEVRDIHPESFVLAGKLKEKSLGVKLLRKIETFGYKNANGIVATMPKFNLYMERKHPNIRFNFCHISQGFNQEQLKESIDIALPNSFNVCYAGGMDSANKMELMVDTALLLSKNININFYFIGDGPLKEKMQKKTKNIPSIFFLESIPKERIISLLSQFDLQIMAWRDLEIYDYGISPNKMVDYLLSAKPILVAYNGYRDILEEVDCGKYIDTDNPHLFAKTIFEFSKMKKSELMAMGKRGREYAFNNMSFNTLSAKLLQFINEVE